MSSSAMLEQAIIDANTLRETAIKNAEQFVVDKYSNDIKKAVEQLLEGNIAEEAKFAHEDLVDNKDCEDEETVEEVKIPVADVVEDEEEETVDEVAEPAEGLMEEVDISLEDLQTLISEMKAEFAKDDDEDKEEELTTEATQEDVSFQEEEELEEAVVIDAKPVPSGYLGKNERDKKINSDLVDAEEVAEESKDDESDKESKAKMEKDQKEKDKLQTEMKQLKTKLDSIVKENRVLKSAVTKLKEGLQEVNTVNSRLFYTNRVLKDDSLNERQKQKIVENLSKAETADAAKIIYETLQSAVGVNSKKDPKSLSEAVNRNSSLIVSSQRQREQDETKQNDPAFQKWQTLAGINKQ